MLDEAEGYAFLRSRQDEMRTDQAATPRLVARRQLSYPVSLLLALLRKKLAEFDAGGGDTRLILSRDEVVELIRIFLPAGSNEVKLIDQVDATLNKIAELGFIRRLRGQGQMIEVRRIIKAFVDAQWLADFDRATGGISTAACRAAGGGEMAETLESGIYRTMTGWPDFVCNGLRFLTGEPLTAGSGRCGWVGKTVFSPVISVPENRLWSTPSPPCWCRVIALPTTRRPGPTAGNARSSPMCLAIYKSERQETLGSAKPVALRDFNSYSVILGVFHNAGYNKTVTLAQVFWMKDASASTGPPVCRL